MGQVADQLQHGLRGPAEFGLPAHRGLLDAVHQAMDRMSARHQECRVADGDRRQQWFQAAQLAGQRFGQRELLFPAAEGLPHPAQNGQVALGGEFRVPDRLGAGEHRIQGRERPLIHLPQVADQLLPLLQRCIRRTHAAEPFLDQVADRTGEWKVVGGQFQCCSFHRTRAISQTSNTSRIIRPTLPGGG